VESDRRRILVVDDSEDVRDFFQIALEMAGYEIDTADNGEEALARLRRRRPDLIILDVVMPRMDGLELLLKLRSDFAPPIPPAILVSGFDLTEDEALRRGAVRFLPKPVDPHDLLDAVADVLGGRRADGAAIAGAWSRAGSARKDARDTATRLMREVEAHAPPGMPFTKQAASLVGFVARYLHIDAAVAAILREDRLRVWASSSPDWIAPDLDLGDALPSVEKILESGSSLVLPDVYSHPSFSWFASRMKHMRCLIGVPIRYDGRAVGVLLAFDSCVCEISGDDLALVQLFSRRGTQLLEAWVAQRLREELPFRVGPGVAPRPVFEEMLDRELNLLHARGGSFELAILGPAGVEEVYDAVAGAANPERLIAGSLGDDHFAIYERSLAEDARERLAAVLAHIHGRAELHSGIVDLTAGLFSSLHATDLLRLAEQAFDDALSTSSRVRRVVVDGESA
jgi:CheY-like chemotaxis protein